jgi:plastocyanin
MSPRWILLALLVAPCGPLSTSAHAATIQIVMEKLGYAPAEVQAKVGDTIEWVNNDILAHTATARDGSWNVVIAPKKTEKQVLQKSGSFDYYCKYHPNMTGKLIVAP